MFYSIFAAFAPSRSLLSPVVDWIDLGGDRTEISEREIQREEMAEQCSVRWLRDRRREKGRGERKNERRRDEASSSLSSLSSKMTLATGELRLSEYRFVACRSTVAVID